MMQRCVRNAGALAPIFKAERQAVKRKESSSRGVATLLRDRCPFAVSGRIVAVVVNPFQGQAIRTRSHVGEKLGKVVYPLLANGYASAAVVLKPLVRRVRASLFHAVPACVFWRVLTVYRTAVDWRPANFVVQATATSGAAAFYGLGDDPFLSATLADAKPVRTASAPRFGLVRYGQSSAFRHIRFLCGHIYGQV